MKRFLFIAVAATVVAVVGANLYLTRQMEEQLDNLVIQLQPMGVLDYGKVFMTPSGEIRVNDLWFRPHGSPGGAVRIDRVAVQTGSLLGLRGVHREMEQGRVPAALGIAIEGLRMETGSNLPDAMAGASSGGGFDAAGCGDRNGFSGYDLAEMGYLDLVMDAQLDYRITGDGEGVQINATSRTRDMADMRVTLDVGLGATSRRVEELAMAAMLGEFLSAELSYRDLGYVSRVIEFCAAETGLDRDEYVSRHIEAWKAEWMHRGMVPGPNLMNGYTRFVQQPDAFRVRLEPPRQIRFMALDTSQPAALLRQLGGHLTVNQLAIGELDPTPMSAAERAAFRAAVRSGGTAAVQSGTTAASAVAASPDGLPAVSIAELVGREGAWATVIFNDGRQYRGQLSAIEADRLQLKRRESGGHFTMPIAFSDIAEIRMRP